MKAKALINLLPIAVVGIVGFTLYQQRQQAEAKPDYDNPNAPQRVGLAPRPEQSQLW